MDSERWLLQRIDILRMKALVANRDVVIPQKLKRKFMSVNVNERNRRGDTLLIEVIRSLADLQLQIQCVNLLLREGADPNLSDTKTARTPLMHACVLHNINVVNLLLNTSGVGLDRQDQNGNSALMLACLSGRTDMVVMISRKLVIHWDFHVSHQRNVMGRTAEEIAKKQANYILADILGKKRLRMLKRMHHQLALLHYSAKLRGWAGIRGLYNAKERFLKSIPPRAQSQFSIEDFPNTVDRPLKRCCSESSLVLGGLTVENLETPRPATRI